ncbi:hypothetical protein ACFQKF_14230 [Halalkalicoccus sp. GCM10025322]|uniref:hypothetical protein n=1 Tax=Halalkalicoccus TaxID=332246 RepID=UPI002F96584E
MGEETRFVCDDFHRMQNPRLMTDDYFESVVEIYDELSEKGLKPSTVGWRCGGGSSVTPASECSERAAFFAHVFAASGSLRDPEP